MSEYMKETIRTNSETTKLEHEVIGPTELAKDMIEAKKDIPFILDIYAAIPRGVSKSDLARMVTLYVRGGHYADLDVRFKTTPSIQQNRVIVYSELLYVPPFVGLANYAISSSPKHPFILMVINEISNRVLKMKDKEKWTEQDVLNTTGPNVLSDVYKAWNKRKEEGYRVSKLSFKTSRSILIHEAAGTWRNDKDSNIKVSGNFK
jgi:mannosyltransferase OCH1-like enzyme